MKEVCMLTQSRTPNQIRSIPSLLATGASGGRMMKAISKKSRKNARKNTKTQAALEPDEAAQAAALEEVGSEMTGISAEDTEKQPDRRGSCQSPRSNHARRCDGGPHPGACPTRASTHKSEKGTNIQAFANHLGNPCLYKNVI